MQDRLNNYLRDLTQLLLSTLQETVSAISVGGSIVYRDFQSCASDVDVAVFLSDHPSAAQLSALARQLDHCVLPCPAKGLDLVAFHTQSVESTPPTPAAAFAFVTGENWRTELTGPEKSPDLLVDLFVLRNHGRTAYGPHPRDLIGSIDERALCPLLAGIIQWHRAKIHDSFHDPTGEFAVLNTCRAWRYFITGIMGSKSAGGDWALARRQDLTVIDAALARRRSKQTGRLNKSEVLQCISAIEIEIDRAGCESRGQS